MTDNLFDNAKFGDMFLTEENKQAVFLRFAENAEYKFAILYIEDWGTVQVFRHNGKAIYDDAAHNIIGKKEEPTIVYVITRCEEHSDYVEEVFFDEDKAKKYFDQFNGNEDEYARHITKVKVTL